MPLHYNRCHLLVSNYKKKGAITIQEVAPFGFKLQEQVPLHYNRCRYTTTGVTFWFQITKTVAVTLQHVPTFGFKLLRTGVVTIQEVAPFGFKLQEQVQLHYNKGCQKKLTLKQQ